MKDETRRYLDDDVSLERLSAEARGEAEAWERLLAAFRAERADAPAPAWLEERVMAEIRALPAASPLSRLSGWLLRPRTFRVPPLAAGLAVAALAALAVFPWARRPKGVASSSASAETVVYVQFDLAAPGARSVSVGGDFDEWTGSAPLEDPDGDGVWSGRVAVRPGLHTYMFLVDGSRWVTDPEAGRYTDDGFGNRNAVLAVAAPAT